jgi:hypothetical protein
MPPPESSPRPCQEGQLALPHDVSPAKTISPLIEISRPRTRVDEPTRADLEREGGVAPVAPIATRESDLDPAARLRSIACVWTRLACWASSHPLR